MTTGDGHAEPAHPHPPISAAIQPARRAKSGDKELGDPGVPITLSDRGWSAASAHTPADMDAQKPQMVADLSRSE